MRYLARGVMALLWGVLVLVVVTASLSALGGEAGDLYDLLDLDPELPEPPRGPVLAVIGLAVLAAAALGWFFWVCHRMLSAARGHDFVRLTRLLGRAGQALAAFWLSLQLLERGGGHMLIAHLPLPTRPELDWVSVELDLMLLVIAIVLWALAGALDRAAEIDDENRHFL